MFAVDLFEPIKALLAGCRQVVNRQVVNRNCAVSLFAVLVVALAPLALCYQSVCAAENLKLKEGISFVHDLNEGFPILGDKMDDMTLASGHPTLLFFGAAGDLNTNRQAKRIVDLYKKYHAQNVKFVIVDVDHPINAQAKALIKSYYQGYIPAQVLFDKTAKSNWTKTGEVETNTIGNHIDKIL